jgi:hypothetical protein
LEEKLVEKCGWIALIRDLKIYGATFPSKNTLTHSRCDRILLSHPLGVPRAIIPMCLLDYKASVIGSIVYPQRTNHGYSNTDGTEKGGIG